MLMKKLTGLTDVSLLGVRVVLAAIYLFHGVPKALNWEMAMEKFAAMGFLPFLGPVVGIIEVICALLLLIG